MVRPLVGKRIPETAIADGETGVQLDRRFKFGQRVSICLRRQQRAPVHEPDQSILVVGRLAESGLTNCVLIEANAYDLANVVRDRVDIVFLANAFHGVSDKPRLAGAVHDVLKPGGLFAIVNWHARPREETIVLGQPRGPAKELRITPEETIAIMRSSGLAFQGQIEVPPYHYAAVFKRRSKGAASSV